MSETAARAGNVTGAPPAKGLTSRVSTSVLERFAGSGYLWKIACVAGELIATSCGVGTRNVLASELRTRMDSNDPKKKVLSGTTGPPNEPPAWWRLKIARGYPRALFSKLLAARREL